MYDSSLQYLIALAYPACMLTERVLSIGALLLAEHDTSAELQFLGQQAVQVRRDKSLLCNQSAAQLAMGRQCFELRNLCHDVGVQGRMHCQQSLKG